MALLLPRHRASDIIDEEAFFAEHTPISRAETNETIAALYHGVVPAFSLCDLPLLARSLKIIHSIGFKEKEVRIQSGRTKQLLEALQGSGFATGLSSMGPLIYVVSSAEDETKLCDVKRIAERHETDCVGIRSGWNQGARIERVLTS